jgi:hypothetical protein
VGFGACLRGRWGGCRVCDAGVGWLVGVFEGGGVGAGEGWI